MLPELDKNSKSLLISTSNMFGRTQCMKNQTYDKTIYSKFQKYQTMDDTIYICGNSINKDDLIDKETYYSNLGYLKSHLQKCIRQSNTQKSLQTAKHFMQMNLNQFLRRLFIIILEDVYIIDEIQKLVWYTAAVSKGYRLNKQDLQWVYGSVVYLCNAKFRDDSEYNHDTLFDLALIENKQFNPIRNIIN